MLLEQSEELVQYGGAMWFELPSVQNEIALSCRLRQVPGVFDFAIGIFYEILNPQWMDVFEKLLQPRYHRLD
eukprot:49701-Eustigmatos_ZCMA.PRE.1